MLYIYMSFTLCDVFFVFVQIYNFKLLKLKAAATYPNSTNTIWWQKQTCPGKTYLPEVSDLVFKKNTEPLLNHIKLLLLFPSHCAYTVRSTTNKWSHFKVLMHHKFAMMGLTAKQQFLIIVYHNQEFVILYEYIKGGHKMAIYCNMLPMSKLLSLFGFRSWFFWHTYFNMKQK